MRDLEETALLLEANAECKIPEILVISLVPV